MSSPVVCTFLFRWILPLVLLGACCFRINGFSLIYLCCLLAVPLLPNPSRAVTSTDHFQKAILGLSVVALTSQIVFQIVLGAFPPYGHFFPNCSTYEQLTRQIGLSRFDGVPAIEVFRIIAPDVIVMVVAIICIVFYRGLIGVSPLPPNTPRHLKMPSDSTTWDNVMPYFIAVMLLIAGIMLPSLASAIYFIIFLILGTMWACHKAFRLRRKKAFAYLRFTLMVYSGLHLVTLYLYQFQFFQASLPPEHLLARLFGLVGIVYTDCSAPAVLHVRLYLRWPDCASPCVILVLYWFLATETRYYFLKEDFHKYGESQTHWWAPPNWLHSSSVERQSLIGGPNQTNYNTLGPLPENVVSEEPVQPIREPDHEEYPGVQGTLGSIIMFLMRQSYIAALIIMMAWSITYHSWLTFVLLLWACVIWITPFARWCCMVSSPGLVIYAELLLLVQYVYGLQLTDDELPIQDPTGTFDYSELGLKKWQFPCLHVGAQTLFTWVFWVTLRQHIREKKMKRRERENEGSLPLRNLAHPFLKALRKMSVGSDEGDALDPKASDDAKALMMWVKSVLAKYWILLCCGAFLLVGLQNEVSVYQIGYMAIFLFILICYQISIATWRLILRPLWWVMVIYSICILLLIYTYQFDNMPLYWHNATGLSDQWLYNLGLRQHTKASLLLELLTPTAFSIVIVIQLHFFHRPFLDMIDLRVRSSPTAYQSTARGAVEPINGPSISRQDDGEFAGTPREPRMSTQKSFLVMALIKIVSFYNDLTVFLWRVGELHMLKLVNLTLICVVLYQVCAINAIIIILLGISMPSRVLQRALSYCFLIWSSLVILSKMIYQLRFVQADLFQHNCTDQTLPRPTSFNHFVNNALWVGFYKTDNISEDIKGYLLIVIVIVLHAVIKHHQKLYRWRHSSREPEPGILFPGITRPDADEGVVGCIKYLCNKFFFHFGWEVCLVVIVINMAVRCDITSVIYAIWLGAFLVLGRENSSVVWPVFVGFMAVLLPLQYLLVLGWPPALCLAYPWTNFLDANLVHWLYLTDVKLPPDPNHLLGDFFQLLFACCQESVFSAERFERSNEEHGTSGTGSNSNRRSGRGHTTTPDFMWNITWLDFFKVFVFQHMYWVTLAVVYITVQSTISIFNFGFILWCFFFLWHGQALYLQPRTRLFRLWKIFLGYNYFTLLAKVCLQLVSCVYVDYVKKHTGCWTLQLLSLFCLRQGGYKNKTDTTISDCVAPDDTGLAMDCACFTFLVIQYRVFTSDYFKHVVRDHREQSDMASRGAELVDDHVRTQLDAVRQEDKRKMDRIRKSLNKLKKKLARLHPEGEQYEPQSHYEAIYSGDYKWFESDSEEDLESDSPTGSPAHGRTPTPSEAEKPETENKDPEHKATVTEATEGAATSGDDGEEGFLEVVGPEVPSESGKPEGFVEKIKRWCSWVYYYIAVSLDRVIDLLNEVSKDYREIADQLKKERKEKRIEKLRRAKFGYWGSRGRGEESSDPEMETKSMTSRVTMEDDDAWSVSNLDLEDVDGGANWRKSNMRISRLTIAFVYALLAHTDILCYMLMILNHMVYASVLSMPLPFLVFLWGLLSIPRPTKNFWITVITYTQIVIVVKYLFKFQFIDIDDCDRTGGLEKSSPMCPPKLIGIERDGHTSAYDLLLLLVLFFHRYSLKVHGLWRDKGIEDESDGTDEGPASPFSPQAGRSGSVILERSLSGESTLSAVQQSQDVENVEGNHKHKNHESGLCLPVVTFFRRISDPEIGSGAVDVYAMMFSCQFIIFIIIVFSWSAFSSPEVFPALSSPEQTPQAPQFMQIIEQNVVPKTFLYMLLSQFFLIVIDRFLYLRKFVIAKLVYNALLVILFHIFMFFIVPLVTQRPFISNVPAIFMYIFKCMYFGLSAYQVRCGYPTRILGNFLTKSYTLTSGILFQGFQAIPFLLELRSVLDWVCTDTTLTLYHWLKMEDIYANIYVLKCYRESEKTWVQPRGQKYWTLGKWGLGGLLVALLVIVIWFPLLFMSYINSVYASILPQDATFTLSIGGYQPLFKVSAQDKSLRILSDDEIDTLKKERSGGFSETQWESFLLNYKGRKAVLQVKIVGNSSSIWTISPPSRDLMTKYLADNNVTLRFSYEFTREPKTALAQETISGVTQVSLDDRTKNQLADMLKGNSSSDDVVIKDLFPSFVGVPASGSVSAVMSDSTQDINYVTCRLRMRSKGSFDWWELTQMSPKPLFGAKENVLEMITFNDPVPPLHFSFFTSTGIIGLYVGFVWLVGKFVRLFFTSISYRIMFDEMPNVDKVLKLCLDIFMVRESKELALEEDLFAKLMFLYRSPQTLIKWTKYKRQ